MVLTFDWVESEGTQLSEEPEVTRVQFGDGYTQRAPAGLNFQPQRWSVVIRGAGLAEGDEIIAFLRAHGGWIAFNWTPPRETVPGLYLCPSWSRTLPDLQERTDINMTFEQTFEP